MLRTVYVNVFFVVGVVSTAAVVIVVIMYNISMSLTPAQHQQQRPTVPDIAASVVAVAAVLWAP